MKQLFNLKRAAVQKGHLEAGAAAGTIQSASFDSLNFRHGIFYIGLVATNAVDYVITLEHSDDNSAWEDVAVAKFAQISGSLADAETADEVAEVVLKSLKRYVRVKLVTSQVGTADVAIVYAAADKDYMASQTDFLDN
jgi:hypothetical protein